MFDKTKARIEKFEETNETFRAVKQHAEKYGPLYIVGAAGLTAGFLLRRPQVINVTNHIANPASPQLPLVERMLLEQDRDIAISSRVGEVLRQNGSATLHLDGGAAVDIIDWQHPSTKELVNQIKAEFKK